MEKNEKIIIAVVAAVIIVAAAIGAVLLSNNNSSDTKDSINGCYFDYRVCGDVTENQGTDNEKTYPLMGTFKMSVLDEEETRYQVEEKYDVSYETDEGTLVSIIKKTETVWIEKNDSSHNANSSTKTISTYWGPKECVVEETKTEKGNNQTNYSDVKTSVPYEIVSKNDTIIMIFMLKNTDFIKADPSYKPDIVTVEFDVNGKYSKSSGEKADVAGTMTMKWLDKTGTCHQIESKITIIVKGTEETLTYESKKWSESSDTTHYGEKGPSKSIETTWGTLETISYTEKKTSTEDTTTMTTYLYKNEIPVQMSELIEYKNGNTIDMKFLLTKILLNGKNVDNIDDALGW